MTTAASETTHVVASNWSRYTTEEERVKLDRLVSNDHGKVADRLSSLIEMFALDPDVGRLMLANQYKQSQIFSYRTILPILRLWLTTMALWQ